MVEQLFYENEIKTNKVVEAAFEIIGLVMVASGLLSCIKFYDEPFKRYYMCLIIFGAIALISCFISYRRYSESSNTKLHLIAIVLLTSGVMNILFPTISIFILFGGILMSAKYYNKRFTLITGVSSAVVFLLGMTLDYYLYHHSDTFFSYLFYMKVLIYEDGSELVLFHIIPRLCIIGTSTFICMMIAEGGRRLVIKQSEVLQRSYEMQKELDAAAVIQRRSMPEPIYSTFDDVISLRAFAQPAKEVGGDLFDYFMIKNHILVVMIADISDKGLASAIYGIRLRIACRYVFADAMKGDDETGLADIELDGIAERINRGLCVNNQDNYFATACIMCIDCNTGGLKYVNAGHEMPIIRHKDGSLEIVANDPMMLMGLFKTSEYRSKELQLTDGDSIMLYTDGLTDARNTDDERYEKERLMDSLQFVEAESYSQIPDAIIHGATQAVNEFIGETKQYDDITAVAFTYCGDEYRYKHIEVRTDEDGIASVEKVLNDYMVKIECPNDFRRIMCTAIDEVIDNIADYSYADSDDGGYIKVKYGVVANEMCIEFRDGGRKFNPVELESPNTDELRLDGYGIMLVKEIADSLEYKYENDENVLTVRKSW